MACNSLHCSFSDGSNRCKDCAISCFHNLPGSLSNRGCSSTVGECLCPHCCHHCYKRERPIRNGQAPGLQPHFWAVKPQLHCQVQSLNRPSKIVCARLTLERKSCCKSSNQSESHSGAVRQMVQVQIFSLSHHNNLFLRGEWMWILCQKIASKSQMLQKTQGNFQEKKPTLFSVTNHRRKCCAPIQAKFKKLHQYHHTTQTPAKKLGVTFSWCIKHPLGKVISESTGI